METAQLERKAALEGELRRIDEEIRAAEERSGAWRRKSEEATREIAALSAQLEEQYALRASGQAAASSDALESDLAEARRLQAGANRLIEQEAAKIAGLRGQRNPLGEELDRIYRQEAAEEERAKIEEMIATAQASLDAFNAAAEKFLADLAALKQFPFADERNRHLAADKWFSLQAQIKGFRY